MREYVPVLLFLLVAIAFAGGTIGLSSIIVPRRRNSIKNSSYECGVEPVGDARERFSVKFYLVAVLFILFDVESVFLVLWAVGATHFKAAGVGPFVLAEIAAFVAILGLALAYVWRKGGLEWDR